MKQKMKAWLLFAFLVIFLTFYTTSVIAHFRLVPLGEILQVDRANISSDGSLVIADKELCYRANLRSDIKRFGEINRHVYVNLIRYKNAQKIYLVDESYPYVAGDVIALDNNLAVMPFHTGGTGCCSAIVSFKYIPKTGDVSLVKSAEIRTAETYLSKENVRDFDRDGNVEILVSICEKGFLSDSIYDQYIPCFSYFLKIKKNGDINIDKNPKLYKELIEGHEKVLSKRFETGAYVSWMFYNRFLKMNESGEKFLKNISKTERERVLWKVRSIDIDRIIREDIEKNVRESSFDLKPTQPCR